MTRFLAVGIGCRKGVSGEAVATAVRQALQDSPLPLTGEGSGVRASALPSSGASRHLLPEAGEGAAAPPPRLFTLAEKTEEPGLIEAAGLLGAPLVGLPLAALEAQASRILTPSPAARARFGIDSVAEAAALAGAGPGGALLAPRLAADGVTCAVALSGDVA